AGDGLVDAVEQVVLAGKQRLEALGIGSHRSLEALGINGQLAVAIGADAEVDQAGAAEIGTQQAVEAALNGADAGITGQSAALGTVAYAVSQKVEARQQGVEGIDEVMILGLGAGLVLVNVDVKRRVAFLVRLADSQADAIDDVVEGITGAGENDPVRSDDAAVGIGIGAAVAAAQPNLGVLGCRQLGSRRRSVIDHLEIEAVVDSAFLAGHDQADLVIAAYESCLYAEIFLIDGLGHVGQGGETIQRENFSVQLERAAQAAIFQ